MPTTWKCTCSAFTSTKVSTILALNAEEVISNGYTFDILMKVRNVTVKEVPEFLQTLLKASDVTIIGRYKDAALGEHFFKRHGIIREAIHAFNLGENLAVFRIIISPLTYDLQLSIHSRIFMDMSLPKLLEKLLIAEGYTASENFEIKLSDADYPRKIFTCQFNESSNNFMARQMERHGVYNYIKEGETDDVLIFADATTEVEKLPIANNLTYSEKKGAYVTSFCRRKMRTAASFTLRDYTSEYTDVVSKQAAENRNGLTNIVGNAQINYYGERNIFGEIDISSTKHIVLTDTEYANKLPTVSINALRTQANLTYGESTIPWLRAGYSITLDGENFQIVSVQHMYNTADTELEKITINRAKTSGFIPKTEFGYRNTFTCIPMDAGPFTPLCQTPRPHISGCVHARIDGDAGSKIAELDSKGRYRVKFFFPEKVFFAVDSQAVAGNYSIPLRMLQPHTGSESGIHFPLHVGADVLVAFMDGDPDRPFIIGSLSNPNNESIVTNKNPTEYILKTPGGNSIVMDDKSQKQKIELRSKAGHSILVSDESNAKKIKLNSEAGSSILISDSKSEEEIKFSNPKGNCFMRLVTKEFKTDMTDAIKKNRPSEPNKPSTDEKK